MKYDEPDTTLRLARTVLGWAFAALAVTCFALAAAAQNADEPFDLLSPAELEELVGPIALYPDDLIGIVLPAATFPLQIVEAARFLDLREDDPSAAPDDDWDDSVVALLNYPEVVYFLNDDLDWTWSLGEAVLNQRADVLDAVQRFRGRARAAGNLLSDNRQIVVEDRDVIEIRHADPEVIYVPYYEPRRVVVYQSAPVIHYHPWAYPVYYYPYPVGYRFDVGFFFGVTSAFVIGWHDHFFHVHHHLHYSHPYYGHFYYDPFYVRRSFSVNINVYGDSYVWAPRVRTVGRPVRFSDGRPVTRTVERRVSAGGTTRTVTNDAGRTTRTTERRASTTGSATTERSSAAGTRTRTTEGSALADSARATTRSGTSTGSARSDAADAGTRTRASSGVGGGARPAARGDDFGAATRSDAVSGQTRTRESAPSISSGTTRVAPSVPNAPSRAAAPRVAPPAPPATQQRTRVVEGRPSQGSTTTQRSITTRPQQGTVTRSPPSSSPRTQTSQPSAPSRSTQTAPRPSAPPSSSSSGSRTRGGDSGNASSSRSQSSGGASDGSRTRTR